MKSLSTIIQELELIEASINKGFAEASIKKGFAEASKPGDKKCPVFCDYGDDCCDGDFCDVGNGEVESGNGQCKLHAQYIREITLPRQSKECERIKNRST